METTLHALSESTQIKEGDLVYDIHNGLKKIYQDGARVGIIGRYPVFSIKVEDALIIRQTQDGALELLAGENILNQLYAKLSSKE